MPLLQGVASDDRYGNASSNGCCWQIRSMDTPSHNYPSCMPFLSVYTGVANPSQFFLHLQALIRVSISLSTFPWYFSPAVPRRVSTALDPRVLHFLKHRICCFGGACFPCRVTSLEICSWQGVCGEETKEAARLHRKT